MYTVGLDKKSYLILYSQNSRTADKSGLKLETSEVTGPPSVPRGGRGCYEKGTIGDMDQLKEIIFGSVLGDGKLELPPRGKNARFGFTQSEGQKDYFVFVCNFLAVISSSKYRVYAHVDKRTGKIYKSQNIWTKALPMLTELYNLFYINDIKTVPTDLSLLTPIALAHWICQDGSRGTCRGLYLCTDGFTHTDVQRLKDYLSKTYNIKCSLHKVNGRYRIYIFAKSVQAVRDLVLPYMHRSMLYKLGI
jgi:hypothetical protein